MESCATAGKMDPKEIYDKENQNELFVSHILNSDPVKQLGIGFEVEYGSGNLTPKTESKDSLVLKVGSLADMKEIGIFNHLLEGIAKNTDCNFLRVDFSGNDLQRETHQDLGAHLMGEKTLDYSDKIRILRYHYNVNW